MSVVHSWIRFMTEGGGENNDNNNNTSITPDDNQNNNNNPPSTQSTSTSKTTTSTETEIIVHTIRLYGSFYIICLFIYTIVRQYYPKLFNIRSWVPNIQCPLARNQQYGYINWFYSVFAITDNELFEQCGMDALCFIRALRFGRILSFVGCLNAIWLIPLYATAQDDDENDNDDNNNNDEIDLFVSISVSHVPNSSKRLLGPVIATYILCIYTMYFIIQEFYWYTKWRHLFLSLKTPQNYACYVSGIPLEYRSSYKLREYFTHCCANNNVNAVVEAHVAMDIPKLERMVSRRAIVIHNLEHAVQVERLTGQHKTHHKFKFRRFRSSGGGGGGGVVQKVNSVEVYQNELKDLNIQIERSIHEITSSNDQYRSQLIQQRKQFNNRPSRNLLLDCDDLGSSSSSDDNDDDDVANTYNTYNHNNNNDDTSTSFDQQQKYSVEVNDFVNDSLIGQPQQLQGCCDDDVTTTNNNNNADVRNCRSRLAQGSWADNNNNRGSHFKKTRLDNNYLMEDIPELPEIDTMGSSSIHASNSKSPNDKIIADDEMDLNWMNNGHTTTATAAANTNSTNTISPAENKNKRPSMLDDYRTFRGIVEKHNTHNITYNDNDDQRIVNNNKTDDDSSPEKAKSQALVGMKQTKSSKDTVIRNNYSDHDGLETADITTTNPVSTSTSTFLCLTNETTSNNDSLRTIQSSQRSNEGETSMMMNNDSASSSQRSITSRLSSSRASLQKTATDSVRIVKFKTLALTATASVSIASGSRAASQSILEVSRKTGETLKSVSKEINADKIIQTAGDTIGKTTEQVIQVGSQLMTHAGAVVPILLPKSEGKPKYAGFVVFSNLYTAQAAIQMIHHTKPYVMTVTKAPQPDDIFWRNVGLPHRARRGGRVAAFACSTILCFFWTVPMGIISSLTEVTSLKLSMPKVGNFIDEHPKSEPFFEQIAPLVLLFFNEAILPIVLKYFATWEGHISASMLEASLFVKLGVFMIIQTFFVSAISGGISAEISNILDDPESIVDFLAESLPAQSSYFIQITLASTFIMQSIEVLRVYQLFLALVRKCYGPNLTPKERQKTWGWFHSLEDPPPFWHAETFAQLILFYMVTFVYQPIAPVTSYFLCFCFVLLESGYRYQLVHNYPVKFDTGGRLWKYWIHFTLASMVIAQLTLIGLLSIKQSTLVGPLMVPLLVVTILFIVYINSEHSKICEFLPTQECVSVDEERNAGRKMDMNFVKGKYLQPSLQTKVVEPDFDVGHDYYTTIDPNAQHCTDVP